MSATVGERKCAVFLAGLQADDRAALLARLPAPVRKALAPLIREAQAHGFDSVSAEALLSKGDQSVANLAVSNIEAAAFDLGLLPPGIPEAWRARIAEAAGANANQRVLEARAIPLPPKLQQALLDEARALVARESVFV